MTAALRRLEYMRGFLSRGEIQSQTGIHWARQEAYIRGTSSLSTDETRSLYNAYSRLSYSQLRESGMSASQASRFRNYAPTSLTDRISDMSTLISNLSEGSVKSIIARQGITVTYEEYLDMINEMQGKVKTGLQESKLTYEQWKEYY